MYTVSQIKRGHFSFRHNLYSCYSQNFWSSQLCTFFCSYWLSTTP